MSLRTIFMGSPEFAVPTLRALHSGFLLSGVVSQPDKARGRGKKPSPTPVKAAALELGVPVDTPEEIASRESMNFLRSCFPQVIVVAAFGEILPEEILQLPSLGCINLHASLLPRHRGASPISTAILAGDRVAGISTMMMDRALDTGDIILQTEIPVSDRDTSGSLHDKMSVLGADLVVKTLQLAAAGRLEPKPQDHDKATYTKLLSKNDAEIDWTKDAEYLDRLVRAMNPWPTAFTRLSRDTIKVWEAEPREGQGEPGSLVEVTSSGILVGTGLGLLLLKVVQAPGKKRIPASDFARGRHLEKGDRFSGPDA